MIPPVAYFEFEPMYLTLVRVLNQAYYIIASL